MTQPTSVSVEQAARDLAELVRKAAWSPHSRLDWSLRVAFRHAVKRFDDARKRKTGFERVLADDGEDLPGSNDAKATRPLCAFCERQFRPRVGQKYCSAECRKKAYHRREARIRHREPPAPEPVVSTCSIAKTLEL